jgi:hypothetical protein
MKYRIQQDMLNDREYEYNDYFLHAGTSACFIVHSRSTHTMHLVQQDITISYLKAKISSPTELLMK